MKITIQRTESKEIEIITPAYYRLGASEVLAIFDEKNVVSVSMSASFVLICNRRWALTEELNKLTDENLIDETEFFECYNKAHAALSLSPVYIDYEAEEIENGSQEGEDWQDRMNDHAETEILNFDK